MIFCELLINLVLYVAALRMMDLQQLIQAHSQTIADIRAMQQALKEMAITVAYLQQGNGVKPIVTSSNRNSKVPGDIKLGNPNCPKRVGVLGRVIVGIKASENLPYAGGAKGKYHMIEHNMRYRIVTSLGNVKRTIGKIKKAMKIKQLLVHPPSSHFT